MRTLLVPALALGLTVAPALARAEEDAAKAPPSQHVEAKPQKKNVVFADLGLHVIGLGFQRTLSPHVAFSLSAGLYDPWTVTDRVGDLRGGIMRIRPYFFLAEEAPRGVWISPFVQGGVVRGEREGVTKLGPTGALGASIGYALLLGDLVHLSLGVGGQLHVAKLEGSAAPPSFYTAGLHLDATAGFAF